MIGNIVTLTFDSSKYNVLNFNYTFERDTDIKGRPTSNYYGGNIYIVLESSSDNLFWEHFTFDVDRWGNIKCLSKGKIEVTDEDGICLRRIEFEAYISNYEEYCECSTGIPMLCRFKLVPLKLKIDNRIKIKRLIDAPIDNGNWQDDKERQVVPQAQPEEETPTIKDAYWTDENDKKIDKALLTDKVRYHIATKGIANGSVVNVTIFDEDSPLPDDKITTAQITINDNKGYAEILLKQDWDKYIESDGGDEIELYGECEYNGQSKEFDDTKGVLNVYAVGYIANDNCRIRIIPKSDGIDPTNPQIIYTKGIIELDIDNLTPPTRYAWNNASKNPENWKDGEIGLSRKLSYVCIEGPNSEMVGINNDSTDPNANDCKFYRVINVAQNKKQLAYKSKNYYSEGYTVGWQRSAGAGLILAVDVINAAVKYGFIFCQDYDNNKIEKHYNILQNVLNIVGEKINKINEKYRTWQSYYYIVNIVLRGENLSGNTELFEIAKKIYKESTNDYEKK